MQKDSSVFQIPGAAAKQNAEVFAVDDEYDKIYAELNAIAEEIEKCRLRNS